MKKMTLLLIILFLIITKINAQNIGINAGGSPPDASAILDVSATDKGMLIPRMTTAQRIAIAAPAVGLMVFDYDTSGFWFYDGAAWKSITGQSPEPTNFRYYASTSQAVNASTNTKVNFGTLSFLNSGTFTNSTFTAPTSGLYNVSTALTIYGNNAASLSVSITVNGSAKGGPSFYVINGVFQAVSFSDNVMLAAGDLVTVQVNASANIAIAVGQGTFFTGFKVN